MQIKLLYISSLWHGHRCCTCYRQRQNIEHIRTHSSCKTMSLTRHHDVLKIRTDFQEDKKIKCTKTIQATPSNVENNLISTELQEQSQCTRLARISFVCTCKKQAVTRQPIKSSCSVSQKHTALGGMHIWTFLKAANVALWSQTDFIYVWPAL